MLRKILSFIVVLTILVGCLPSVLTKAASGVNEYKVSWSIGDDGCLYLTGSGILKNGNGGWSDYSSGVTSIVLSGSFTEIGDSVFQGYSSLKKVTFPTSLVRIGDYAFEGCVRLESITFPENTSSIGDYSFANTGISNISFNEKMWKLGNYAFSGCNRLASVIISDEITEISNGAFSNCSRLKGVIIGNSVTQIKASAFAGCSKLEKVDFGGSDNLTYIRENAFVNCNLKELVLKSKNLRTLGAYSFSGNDNLETVYLPKNLQSARMAFAYGRASSIKDVYYEGSIVDWTNMLCYVENLIGLDYQLEYATKHWEHNLKRTYEIKYMDAEGEIGSLTLEEGEYAPYMAPGEKEGYNFKGWYANKYGWGEPFIDENGIRLRKISSDITLYPIWEQVEEFTFGRDTFSFNNEGISMGDYYTISDEYFNVLMDGIEAYDGLKIEKTHHKNRAKNLRDDMGGGSCFGMSSVMMLAYEGKLDPGFFHKEADNVFDLPAPAEMFVTKNKTIMSLVNFYQIAQVAPQITYKRDPWITPSVSEIARKLVYTLKGQSGKKPVMVNYDYNGEVTLGNQVYKMEGKHSVIAYKLEDDGVQYKVYLADPNYMVDGEGQFHAPRIMTVSYDYSKIACSLYSTDDSVNKLKVRSVLDDSSIFDDFDLQEALTNKKSGRFSLYSSEPMLLSGDENEIPPSMLEINYKNFRIHTESADSTVTDGAVEGEVNITDSINAMEYGGRYSFYLGEEYDFTLVPETQDVSEYKASIMYNQSGNLMNAYSKDKAVFDFASSGYVNASSESVSKKEISLCVTDEKFPWESIRAEADAAEISMKYNYDGTVSLVSDTSLENAHISVTKDGNEINCSPMADCTEITISENEGKTVVIANGTDFSFDSTYTVNFNTHGGEFVESTVGITGGSVVEMPADPEREGFIFGGWYIDEECTQEWDFSENTVNENVVLHAKWEENPEYYHIVTFDDNDNITQIIVENGDDIPKEEYPELVAENGVFKQWEDIDTSCITSDLTIYSVEYSDNECVSASAYIESYKNDTLNVNVYFDTCVCDCVMLAEIYNSDESVLQKREIITIDKNTESKAFSMSFTNDDEEHILKLSFADNATDMNPIGNTSELWFGSENQGGDNEYILYCDAWNEKNPETGKECLMVFANLGNIVTGTYLNALIFDENDNLVDSDSYRLNEGMSFVEFCFEIYNLNADFYAVLFVSDKITETVPQDDFIVVPIYWMGAIELDGWLENETAYVDVFVNEYFDDAEIIVAIYNPDGKLEKFGVEPVDENTRLIPFDFENCAGYENYEIKAFYWSKNKLLMPLSSFVSSRLAEPEYMPGL